MTLSALEEMNMRLQLLLSVGCVLLIAYEIRMLAAAPDEKPAEKPGDKKELSIGQIMLRAHLTPNNRSSRNNLDNKVLDNKATYDEKKELLELYSGLRKQIPPKGKSEEWDKRVDELVESLKAVYAGEKGATDRFTKAKDCKSCHTAHR
jgi:hypothetical protein